MRDTSNTKVVFNFRPQNSRVWCSWRDVSSELSSTNAKQNLSTKFEKQRITRRKGLCTYLTFGAGRRCLTVAHPFLGIRRT